MSIRGKFSILMAGLLVAVLGGNWYAFIQVKHSVQQDMEQYGGWMVNTLTAASRDALLQRDSEALQRLVENHLGDNNMMYIALTDPRGNILHEAHLPSLQTFMLPHALRQGVCAQVEKQVDYHLLDQQQIYNVRGRIRSHFIEAEGETDTLSRECLGAVHVGLAMAPFDQTLSHLMGIFVLIGALGVGLGGIGYAAFSRLLMAPLAAITHTTQQMLGDDSQYASSSDIPADEIRLLENACTSLLERFTTFVTSFQRFDDQLHHVADNLGNIMEQHASVAEKQAISIHHVSQSAADLATSSQQLNTASKNVTSGCKASLEVAQRIERTVQNTIRSLDDIRIHGEKSSERIELLGEKISQIHNVVKMINTIADQTRMLAFNASIEAAGAGEAGGRFSIVATEVRRLANTVVESIEDIKASASSIQSATNELILSSESGLRNMNYGASLITDTRDTLQHLMTLLQGMTQEAEAIAHAGQFQTDEHPQVSKAIQDVKHSSDQLIQIMYQKKALLEEFHTMIEEIDTTLHRFFPA